VGDVPEPETIRKLTVTPDDVIVLRFNRPISAEQAHLVIERAREQFGTQRVMVLDSSVEVGVMLFADTTAGDPA
jgi:hypothetical protein